jgi:prepilin peptidase CpaA
VAPFAGTAVGITAGIVFSAILVAAAVGDVRSRRIPNMLVGGLAVLGLVYSAIAYSLLEGLARGTGGLFTGLVVWLPFYALGWIGAGDVKLFAGAGAWLGPWGALEGALVSALAGAVLALLWMVRSRGLRATTEVLGMSAGSPSLLAPADGSSRRSTLPYGVALAFGALWAKWLPGLLLA